MLLAFCVPDGGTNSPIYVGLSQARDRLTLTLQTSAAREISVSSSPFTTFIALEHQRGRRGLAFAGSALKHHGFLFHTGGRRRRGPSPQGDFGKVPGLLLHRRGWGEGRHHRALRGPRLDGPEPDSVLPHSTTRRRLFPLASPHPFGDAGGGGRRGLCAGREARRKRV